LVFSLSYFISHDEWYGRVFTYENQAANPLIPNPKLAQRKLFADDRKMHFMFQNDFATNGNDGEMMLQNTRWSIGTNGVWVITTCTDMKQKHILAVRKNAMAYAFCWL
jgi:hypothetical protein